MSRFKVGDRVFHVGSGNGRVARINPSVGALYPVEVHFDDSNLKWMLFTMDGKYDINHIVPQLLTVQDAREKGYDVPKQKVTKTIETTVYVDKTTGTRVSTNASSWVLGRRMSDIVTVKMTGTYETEE